MLLVIIITTGMMVKKRGTYFDSWSQSWLSIQKANPGVCSNKKQVFDVSDKSQTWQVSKQQIMVNS